MARLVWTPEQKKYEFGVDHGVLYPQTGPGVVWNGLINVEESFVGGEVDSYYFDGIKYIDKVSPKNYQATVTAFSAPGEFSSCVGDKSVIPGFVLTRQPRTRFSFSYRTQLGDGIGYKIHLVYNAIASNTAKGYSTTKSSISANQYSWKIDATPPWNNTYRPSAHFIIDSTKINPDTLAVIEDILYGTETLSPRLPTIESLLDLIQLWSPLILNVQVVTGLSTLTAGNGDLYKTKVDGINRALPATRLQPSLISGLYRME